MVKKSSIYKFFNNFSEGGKQRYWPTVSHVLTITVFKNWFDNSIFQPVREYTDI